MKCVFWHKLVVPKFHTSCLNELTFKGNISSFTKLLTIFCADFMSLLMVINRKNISIKVSIYYFMNNATYYEFPLDLGL